MIWNTDRITFVSGSPFRGISMKNRPHSLVRLAGVFAITMAFFLPGVVMVNPVSASAISVVHGVPSPSAMTTSGNLVWVLTGAGRSSSTLVQINAKKRVVKRRILVPWAVALNADSYHLWVVTSCVFLGDSTIPASVEQLNIYTGDFNQSINLPSSTRNKIVCPNGIALDGHTAWIVDSGSIYKFDQASGQPVGGTPSGPFLAIGIASLAGEIWMTGTLIPGLTYAIGRIENGRPAPYYGVVYGFDNPGHLVASGGSVWVSNYGNSTVTQVDQRSGSEIQRLAGVNYGFNGLSASVADGAHVWFANRGTNSITEVNSSNGSLKRLINGHGLNRPVGMAIVDGYLWVLNAGSGSVSIIKAK